MHDALWNISEHTGWQVIHAYCEGQGAQRKYTHRMTSSPSAKFDISFRDTLVQDAREIGSEYENLRI